jgi:hypothetical protein
MTMTMTQAPTRDLVAEYLDRYASYGDELQLSAER